MDSRHNVGTNPWNEAAVPVVGSGTHHLITWYSSGEEGTLPSRDRSVLRPRPNWEGGTARNNQKWYHVGSSELGLGLVLITKVLDRGRVVVRRKRDKPLTVVHVDRLEAYRGMVVPAWMTAEQRGCVAV